MPLLFLRDAIDEGRLVQLWPDAVTSNVTFAAMYPSRAGLPAKARAFIDFVMGLSD
jgi:DNA-binding transcriptional LysR family regulator